MLWCCESNACAVVDCSYYCSVSLPAAERGTHSLCYRAFASAVLDNNSYRLREEFLQAKSNGTVVSDTSVVTSVEEELYRVEDWLYEEETYDIMDAAVFEQEQRKLTGACVMKM